MFVRCTPLRLLAITLLVSLALPNARAQTEQKLTASDGGEGDQFGYAVAVSGDVAVIGAQFDDAPFNQSGSAYVFRRVDGTWVEEQKLTASDGDDGDHFGYAVAVSGDVAVVGAYQDEDLGSQSGSAYVYRYDGAQWVEEQKLLASNGGASDRFGRSVAVSGDVVLVGADGEGAVYAYRYDGAQWVEEQKLTASDGGAGVGWSAAVSGDVAVVGAFTDDDLGDNSGSAYVFRYDGATWVEEQKLTASDGSQGDHFGFGVAVSGDVALVGAYGDGDLGGYSGSAYVFRYDGAAWGEEQKLRAADGNVGDVFGYSVAIMGEVAVVGAPMKEHPGLSGAAYVYLRTEGGWVQEPPIRASDAERGAHFGWSVATSGEVAIVGARYDPALGHNSGAAYAYDLTSDCAQSLTATLDDDTPVPGQTITFSVTVTNADTSPAPLDLWLDASGPVSRTIRLGSGTLPAGATVTRDVRLRIPSGAPSGGYSFNLAIGDFATGAVCDAVPFAVTIGAPRGVGAPRVSGSGAETGAAFAVLDDFFAAPASVAAPELVAVSPNPTSDRAVVAFALDAPSAVRLALYDVLGREVAAVDAGRLAEGAHRLGLDVSSLPSGVYVWRLVAGGRTEAGRLTVAR